MDLYGPPCSGESSNVSENPEKIGNVSKPPYIECMPACQVQENANQMSFAFYPQMHNFFYQKKFCYVASHIWQATCKGIYNRLP